MSVIKKIYIASDPLMTKEKEQFSNRRWMRDLLLRPIKRATGILPETLASSLSDPALIDRKTFFGKSGIDVDTNATQFWFDDSQIGAESLAYLSGFVDPSTLVIGYELSEQTRRILDRLDVPYIDIWLHPIRFLDDVLFGFNSNMPAVRNQIFTYNMAEDAMFLYADRIRVQTYKGWRRVEAAVKPNSALFVGQMNNDKSVCRDGKMLSLLDFKEEFAELCRTHDRVYYSRHPYMRGGDEEVLAYLKTFPNVEMTREPSYRMLSHHNIKTVVSISSSVLQEARYFSKQTRCLYRPIVPFGDKSEPSHFASILQDFVSPHFWSDILAPVLDTQPCPKIAFTDPKDKLRDMLGFYWSYSDIDKTEHMRKTLLDLPQKVKSMVPNLPAPTPGPVEEVFRFTHPDGFLQTEKDFAELFRAIEDHDVISFDVFDTLVERVLDQPSDLFPLLSDRARVITGGALKDFPEARKAARNMALDMVDGEEIPLTLRYAALERERSLPTGSGRKLMHLELAAEKAVCRPRFVGLQALTQARKAGKRVILVSDTYFDRNFMESLLETCGITDYDHLYLSSEEKVLKQTGRLFERVLKLEGIEANRVLHIGDNTEADIRQGRERGLDAFHISDKRRISAALGKTMAGFDKISDIRARTLIKGLASRHLTHRTLPYMPGATLGDPHTLGYAIVGPVFWGFARWVLEEAQAKGLTDIYFLARDGEIVKRCYDILTREDDTRGAPRSHYIMGSRRAVSVAGIEGPDDVVAILQRNFTPCSLRALMENRFGLDASAFPRNVFTDYGFGSADARADWRTNAKNITDLFLDERVMTRLLEQAREERRLLLAHYTEAGLGSPGCRAGFVDIGHSGSLQAAITQMMNLGPTHGMYFATNKDTDKVVAKPHSTAGYTFDRFDPKVKTHPYQRHILMFELLFQNMDGSFLRFWEDAGGIHAQCIDTGPEADRIAFIEQVHNGACAFTEDLSRVLTRLGIDLKVKGSEVISAYTEMLSRPWPRDAAIFQGIGFENRYSARDMRWILPPPEIKGESLWPEGAKALATEADVIRPLRQRLVIALAAAVTRNPRKRAKLYQSPERFFRESRLLPLRGLGYVMREA